MRALARNARLIVMDEPTSSLTAHETTRLHELIIRLREQGRTVVYVSHFLDAVLDVSDRITILRDGRLIRTGDVRDETKRTIIEGMLGRELAVSFPERAPGPADGTEPILRLDGVGSEAGVFNVSLQVRPGEIVGLLGLVGSGRTEIARAIVGADKKTAGTVTFQGRDLGVVSPRTSTEKGIVLVPEDRHSQGLVLDRSVRENIALAFLHRFSRFGIVRGRAEKAEVASVASQFGIRPLRISLAVRGLSGGNQQKALLAKWLIGSPSFVILDEPTRGVDVGAKLTIYKLIVALASQGVGVLLISSEHEEVLGLAHRAYLVSRGTVTGEIDPTDATVETVLRRLFAVEESEELKETTP
jgi:simple sugar transport system ATP-binding protein/ribose transport system ATP-binding protein